MQFLIDYLWIAHRASQSYPSRREMDGIGRYDLKSLPIFLMPLQSPLKAKRASPQNFKKQKKKEANIKEVSS